MATKKSGEVTAYLKSLPPETQKVMSTLRQAVLKTLPRGYEEALNGKIIAYVVPLSRLPKTYNGHPLWYAALAAQKNYYAVHLMSAYGDSNELSFIQKGFAKARKKLDMGKACIRFKKLEDLPLDVIAKSIARVPMEAYVERYEALRKK